jgi:hypothetical protein
MKMEFKDTGLPDNMPHLKEAFALAYEGHAPVRQGIMDAIKQVMDMGRARALGKLNESRKDLGEDAYKKGRAQINTLFDNQLALEKRKGLAAADKLFMLSSVAPALEVYLHSDRDTPENIAAALLAETTRSHQEYERIRTQFGQGGVHTVVAGVSHIAAYPDDKAAKAQETSPAARSVWYAHHINNIARVANLSREMAELEGAGFSALSLLGEQEVFDGARAVWGNDKKLDRRFVEVFNEVASFTKSDYRVNVSAEGKPVLARQRKLPPLPPPKKPPDNPPKEPPKNPPPGAKPPETRASHRQGVLGPGVFRK